MILISPSAFSASSTPPHVKQDFCFHDVPRFQDQKFQNLTGGSRDSRGPVEQFHTNEQEISEAYRREQR